MERFTYKGVTYFPSATFHNSPFDRGRADSYYRRYRDPHYYSPTTAFLGQRVGRENMTPAEVDEYDAGYAHNEMQGDHKDYEHDPDDNYYTEGY